MLNTNYHELSINYMANYMAIRVKKNRIDNETRLFTGHIELLGQPQQ